jgi:hypothetical protein
VERWDGSPEESAGAFPWGRGILEFYHFHVLTLDGVISGDVERGVRFYDASGLESRDAMNRKFNGPLRWEAR